MENLPFISVIVPAHNSARTIEKTLDSLATQNYPASRMEIIVVNNGSSDDTGDRVRRFPVTLIEEKRGDPGLARNLGVEASKGSIVLFLDSDVAAGPTLLRYHAAAHLSHPDCGGVGGPIRLSPGAGLWEKCDHYASWYHHHDRLKGHVTPNQPTANLSLRRDVWERVGGFKLGIFPAEDREFQERFRAAGFKVWFDPSAWVYHYNRVSYRAYMDHNFRWAYHGVAYKSGAGRSRFPWAYPKNEFMLLLMVVPFAVGSWGYTLWQWIRCGVYEPLWLSPLLLMGRFRYAWGVYAGGREFLRKPKSEPVECGLGK